jgi:hypothetical protein
MKTKLLQFWVSNRILVCAVIGVALSLTARVDNLINFAGRGHIHQTAIEFLEKSEQTASETFLVLSAAKSGLAILQTSQGGVTFIIEAKVQVGEAFNTLTELVSRAWEASFASLSILFVTRQLLEIASWLTDTVMIVTALIGLSYAILQRWQLPGYLAAGNVLRSTACGAFLLIIALPLAIYLTALLSEGLTGKISAEATQTYQAHNALFQYDSDTDAQSNFKQSTHNVLNRYKAQKGSIHQHVTSMHTQIYRHIAIIILETLLLPIGILSLLYCGARRVLKKNLPLVEMTDVQAGRLKRAMQSELVSYKAEMSIRAPVAGSH